RCQPDAAPCETASSRALVMQAEEWRGGGVRDGVTERPETDDAVVTCAPAGMPSTCLHATTTDCGQSMCISPHLGTFVDPASRRCARATLLLRESNDRADMRGSTMGVRMRA